jgi:UDP-glucose 4-epimerase
LLVSTDKACSPSNVYGMSKALAERLITSSSNENKNTKYIAVRYGNVLESRGSILPLFRFQGEFKSHLTVTHTNMTRFIMTLEESVDLIVSALLGAKSGELWLPKLKSMKIIDLAEIFSEQYSKPIKIVGIRPGEKLHEDLISHSESMRVRVKNSVYIMQSSLKNLNSNKKLFNYSSNQDLVSKKELKTYLKFIKVFDKPLDQFIGKKIDDLETI